MGMRIIRREDRDFVSGRLPSETWEITAEEWHAWKKKHTSVRTRSTTSRSR
jgi:hypothetical protein